MIHLYVKMVEEEGNFGRELWIIYFIYEYFSYNCVRDSDVDETSNSSSMTAA